MQRNCDRLSDYYTSFTRTVTNKCMCILVYGRWTRRTRIVCLTVCLPATRQTLKLVAPRLPLLPQNPRYSLPDYYTSMSEYANTLTALGMCATVSCMVVRRRKVWLENILGAGALHWVKAQNKSAIDRIGDPKAEGQTEDYDRLLQMYDSKEKIPYVTLYGDQFYYNFWTDEKHVRGIWRRTTLTSYASAEPEWETVLDLDALNEKEGASFVWKGATVLQEGPASTNPSGQLCFVKLSPGGGDAITIREFDLEKKQFVENGFIIPVAKSAVSWYDRDTVLVGTDDGTPGSMTDSGYPRTTRKWKRGTKFTSAPIVFEGLKSDMSVAMSHIFDPRGYEYEARFRTIDFYSATYEFREISGVDNAWYKMNVPVSAKCDLFGDQLLVELRSDWSVGKLGTVKAGSLLSIPFREHCQGNNDGAMLLFEPKPEASLDRYFGTRSYLVLELLEHVKFLRQCLRYIPTESRGESAAAWEYLNLTVPASMDNVFGWAHDDDSDDLVWSVRTGFLTPSTVELIDMEALINGSSGQYTNVSKSAPSFFNEDLFEVQQHFCTSVDGTRVPYFQISKKDLVLDGSNPTLQYGYGGFEISMTPYYSGTFGMLWLEKGGVFVMTNIRGGNEYGPEWHKDVLLERRYKAYEDFESIAEDLMARKVTSPSKLGIMGGSNGGLLVGNCMTRRPELFGAIVCQVPLLDMERYTYLLAGASWAAEFGDPDVPGVFDGYLRNHSPYHRLLDYPQKAFPPAFFYTSTRDDRVHPGHARKMVERLQQLGHSATTYYYENVEGGHGSGADNLQRAFTTALTYRFLNNVLM